MAAAAASTEQQLGGSTRVIVIWWCLTTCYNVLLFRLDALVRVAGVHANGAKWGVEQSAVLEAPADCILLSLVS